MSISGARIGINVGFLFTDRPLEDRFRAAADLGCPLVEFPWLPATPREVAAAVGRTGVDVVLMNVDAGDLALGWRGFAHLPDSRAAWRRAFTEALHLAADVGAQRLNVLAGAADPALPTEVQLGCLRGNLRWAAEQATTARVQIVVEHLNTAENPGYLLAQPGELVAFLADLDGAVLAELDVHHLVLSGADLPTAVTSFAGRVGHVQLADEPGRGAPGTGTLPWPRILAALERSGYTGPWMLEFRPPPGEDATSIRTAVETLTAAGRSEGERA